MTPIGASSRLEQLRLLAERDGLLHAGRPGNPLNDLHQFLARLAIGSRQDPYGLTHCNGRDEPTRQGLTEQDEDHFRQFLSMINVVDVLTGDAVLKNRIVEIRRANAKIKLPDAIVMASASITRSILLTRDHQLLNSDFCETLEF